MSLIAAIILCTSIIVAVFAITGLGVKITSLIMSASNDGLWPSLLLTALACLVLGMKVPTTAAYVICGSVAGPSPTTVGLEPLQAHLLMFLFALLSTITPPVCGAVFIAAGMAEEYCLRVAMSVMALGVWLYLIPLGMIAGPDLIRLAEAPGNALLSAGLVGGGCIAIPYALIGVQRPLYRVAGLVLGMALIFVPASG